jgi:hypothetical protein
VNEDDFRVGDLTWGQTHFDSAYQRHKQCVQTKAPAEGSARGALVERLCVESPAGNRAQFAGAVAGQEPGILSILGESFAKSTFFAGRVLATARRQVFQSRRQASSRSTRPEK